MESPPPSLPPSTPPASQIFSSSSEQPAVRLPLVRVLYRGMRRPQVLAIYDDHLVMGFCRRNYSFSEAMLGGEGEAELVGQLDKVRRMEFNDLAEVTIHPGKFIHYFKLRARSGMRLRFSLLKAQAGHVGLFLRTRFADKIPFHRLRAGKMTGVLVVMLGLFMGLWALSLIGLNQRGSGALVGVLGLGAVMGGLWLLFGRGTVVTAVDPRVLAAEHHLARHAAIVAKPPLRSKPLGWMLKLLGVAYWFFILSPLTDPFRQWLDTNLGSAQAQSYIWTALWFPAPLLIFIGYRLCQRRYIPKQGGDPRKPILFLRPFEDDEHTSLQPNGLTARATGIRSRSAYVQGGHTDIFDLLWSAHPVRMMRMIADFSAGSSEESIARYFEKHGPVIAIGKPGERLASPGAARMYLTDATWQDAILCEMERAQAVVMQPAPSDGVRWELNHIREKVAPGRFLLCLVSYWNNPEYYEDLMGVVAESLRVQLPRVIPYLKRPTFVYFDEAWNPHVQELSYKDPVLWPITFDGADLHYSLAGFVEGMQGGKTQPARPPQWIGGPKSWAACVAAVVLATILLVVPNAVVAVSGELLKVAAGGVSIFSGEKRMAEAFANSPKTTLKGHAVAYQLEIPGTMTALQPQEATIEYWGRSPDSRFELQIVAANDLEDLSTLPQIRLKANSKDVAQAGLDFQRQIEVNGLTWTDGQITATAKDGTKVKEIMRGTSGNQGTVLFIIHIIVSPASEAIYQKVAEDCLQSFKFADAPEN